MTKYIILVIIFFLFLGQGYSQEIDILSKRQSDSIYLKSMKADGVKIISIRDNKYKVWTKNQELEK